MEQRTFRLCKGAAVVWFEVISDFHWKVVGVRGPTGSVVGDEVSPVRRISWREARRRVNSRRTAVSPNALVLLRGEDWERSDADVSELLSGRPWDPEGTGGVSVRTVGPA